MEVKALSWGEVSDLANSLCARASAHTLRSVVGVYGIPTGGSMVAQMVAARLNKPLLDSIRKNCLIVDDLIDSGATLERIRKEHPDIPFWCDVLLRKPHSPTDFIHESIPTFDAWIKFPWDNTAGADPTDAVVRILQWLGEDPNREGLQDTPRRVLKALREMTQGYHQNPEEILSTRFGDVAAYDEMIMVSSIPFQSLCEHHMLPFTGTVDVGYLPNTHVIGLSKIPRLVNALSRQLQVQERMTVQIADMLQNHLQPKGVGVVVRGKHSCMCLRGVRSDGMMVISSRQGIFRTEPAVRDEFLRLAHGNRH